jgi:creatinine amidohydrolase
MLLESLSWTQIAEHIRKQPLLILPVGSCEQHGEHLPVSTDSIITLALAKQVGDRTDTLVAPLLPYGINLECDAHFPGGITLSYDALRGLVENIAYSLISWGVKDIVVITAHACASENYSFAHQEAIKTGLLPVERAGSARTHIIYPYWGSFSDILEKDEGIEHAGEGETSLLLYLAPDLVNMKQAVDRAEPEQFSFRAFPEGVSHPGDAPAGGSEGNPSCGSAKKGELIFERMVASAEKYIRSLIK